MNVSFYLDARKLILNGSEPLLIHGEVFYELPGRCKVLMAHSLAKNLTRICFDAKYWDVSLLGTTFSSYSAQHNHDLVVIEVRGYVTEEGFETLFDSIHEKATFRQKFLIVTIGVDSVRVYQSPGLTKT